MASILYSEYLTHLERLRQFEKKITTPPFALMVIAAFFIHLLVLLIWSFIPQSKIFELPVRHMNLSLMSGEEAGKLSNKPKTSHPKNKEAAKSKKKSSRKGSTKRIPKKSKEIKPKIVKVVSSTRKASVAPKKIDLPWERSRLHAKSVSDIATNLSSALNAQIVKESQSPYGASGRNAGWKDVKSHQEKVMTRYEQLLSRWIDKHKVYPHQAQMEKMQGRVLLRLRIDRAGNVKFILIQKSSGKPLLDRAVIQAARKANPMPAVPANYPGGHLLEFVIAVDFVYQG